MYLPGLWQYIRFVDEPHHKLSVKSLILVYYATAHFDWGLIHPFWSVKWSFINPLWWYLMVG
jgi:hypothetical protein